MATALALEPSPGPRGYGSSTSTMEGRDIGSAEAPQLRTARRSAPHGVCVKVVSDSAGPSQRRPQVMMASGTGYRSKPFSVSRYSWRTAQLPSATLARMPSWTSRCSRCDKMFGAMSSRPSQDQGVEPARLPVQRRDRRTPRPGQPSLRSGEPRRRDHGTHRGPAGQGPPRHHRHQVLRRQGRRPRHVEQHVSSRGAHHDSAPAKTPWPGSRTSPEKATRDERRKLIMNFWQD
ncbi:MAG: hypothetical protein JWR34_5249 [Mycobacterium sp.]|nr:hypothetical protein [Mycobacterium sp.]